MSASCPLVCERCGIPHSAHPDGSANAPSRLLYESGDTLCAPCMHILDYRAPHIVLEDMTAADASITEQTTLENPAWDAEQTGLGEFGGES
jgi:hypothetical protein